MEGLVLAMVAIDDVIDALFVNAEPPSDDKTRREGGWLEEQDAFVEIVDSCWQEASGPSERYLKALVRRYVAALEGDRGICPESDGLCHVVQRASLSRDHLPEPGESCYLFFRVPRSSLLRIKVYPYHNDVSLRLWEAGVFLAEYFLQNQILGGKKVFELGAGVGLTGLVVAGCCGADSVHLTDYSEECRINLDHNLSVNRDWLLDAGGSVNVSQVGAHGISEAFLFFPSNAF